MSTNGGRTTAMTTGWQAYLSWNTAVAEAVYPPLEHRRIVFLDLEGDALAELAEMRSISKDEVVPNLVSACRGVVNIHRRTSIFQRFVKATREWQAGDRLKAPPSVALLATFSLAAERMEGSEGVGWHKYYVQLARLLDLDGTGVDVGQSYRKACEELWDSLATWLRYQEGRRGDPVEFSVGDNYYVGLAKAQALVRDVDRRRFQAFFQDFDLAPGSQVPPNELEELLDAWIASSRSVSSHIRGLWRQEVARPHLTAAVADTLSVWDGHLTNRHRVGAEASRIRITLARQALRRGIDLGVTINAPEHEEARTGVLHAADGDVEVQLDPGGPGELRVLNIQNVVEARSILEGILQITDPVAGALKRLPRNLIVLRQDPFAAVWHEVTQVRLGDAVAILARESEDIEEVLSEISASSWTIYDADELPGLPEGWRLVEDVTVVAQPSQPLGIFDDVRTLVPITRTAFNFAEGLTLPVGENSYHVDGPPVVTIGMGGGEFSVTLFDLQDSDPLQLVEPWESSGEPLSISIEELDLDPGVYGLIVRTADGSTQQREFTLVRSGEFESVNDYDSVTHDAGTGLGVVCADNSQEADWPVEGLPLFEIDTDGEEGGTNDGAVPRIPWWRKTQQGGPGKLPAVPIPAADSCLRTGAHRVVIEQAVLNHRMRAVGTSLGVCQGCGRVQQYSNNYRRNYRDWEQRRFGTGSKQRNTRALKPKNRTLGSAINWDTALDIVISVGGGDARLLRRLTRQFDPSALFFQEFVNTLQSAGHIEVERDPDSLEVVAWETAPTAIVECGRQRRLSGHWPAVLVEELRRRGIDIRSTRQPAAPSIRTTRSSVDEISAHVPDALIVRHPGLTLARSLPPLSAVLHALPSVNLPDVLNFEHYMPSRDAWSLTPAALAPGAYRTIGYKRHYYVVVDADSATAKRVTPAMAKHAAALLEIAPRALFAYSAADRELIVPLGAPIPGLYGRALGLASGRARERRDTGRSGSFEVYPEISPELATIIQRLLES